MLVLTFTLFACLDFSHQLVMSYQTLHCSRTCTVEMILIGDLLHNIVYELKRDILASCQKWANITIYAKSDINSTIW